LKNLSKSRILFFLNKNKFFSENQSGFLPGKSTIDALVSVDTYIRSKIDNDEKVIGIFLDVKKAFDSVNPKLLISKLENCGIRGVALQLMISFFSNRYQAVRLGNVISTWLPVCGVPQGTVLQTITIYYLF